MGSLLINFVIMIGIFGGALLIIRALSLDRLLACGLPETQN